jgi:glycosyltransferase involved in cell wall biosynthesis
MVNIAILADSPLPGLEQQQAGRSATAATWLVTYADYLSRQGDLKIHWITLQTNTANVRCYSFNGISYLQIPRVNYTLDALTSFLTSRFRLVSTLRSIRPDLIHTWGSERPYGSVHASFPGPSIFSLQGLLLECSRVGGLPNSLYWNRQVKAERSFVGNATVVTAESLWAANGLARHYGRTDVRLIEYGVHPSFFDIQWCPSPNEPIFLFVGSLSYLKGMDVFIKAIRMTANKHIRFFFAGDGPYAQQLQEMNDPRVQLLGTIPWHTLQSHMAKAWALVCPTRADTGPMVVKEARVLGMPVITTPDGGQTTYIQDAKNGILIGNQDPAGFARAMDLLASNFSLVREMGARDHALHRQLLDPQKMVDSFCNLYRELAGPGIPNRDPNR